MAKRATATVRERPYHCRLCNEPRAEDELGYVCCHVAHGTMVTLVADTAGAKEGQVIPDTACTACILAMDAKKKNADANADVHVVCARCYRECRKRNIDDFTPADRAQGYVLAKRPQYDRLEPRTKPLDIGKIYEGRVVKLGFSPIPSTHPISLERMWVRVTCLVKGALHGALANDPELFKRKTLKADDTVVFAAKHILDVIPETKKSEKAAMKRAEAAKKVSKAAARKPTKMPTRKPTKKAAKKAAKKPQKKAARKPTKKK